MITIRLQRRGKKNDPTFRVVVVDSKKKPKTGNYLEMVGSHDPRRDRTALNGERIVHWMGHGAQVSDTVHNLLVSHKIIDAKKINILPAYKNIKQEAVRTPSAGGTEAPSEVQENPVEEVVEEALVEEVKEDNHVAQEVSSE